VGTGLPYNVPGCAIDDCNGVYVSGTDDDIFRAKALVTPGKMAVIAEQGGGVQVSPVGPVFIRVIIRRFIAVTLFLVCKTERIKMVGAVPLIPRQCDRGVYLIE